MNDKEARMFNTDWKKLRPISKLQDGHHTLAKLFQVANAV